MVRLSQGKFVHCLLRRGRHRRWVCQPANTLRYGTPHFCFRISSFSSLLYCNSPTNPILGVPFFVNCDFVICVNGGAFRKRAAPIERRRTFDGGRNLGSSCGRRKARPTLTPDLRRDGRSGGRGVFVFNTRTRAPPITAKDMRHLVPLTDPDSRSTHLSIVPYLDFNCPPI